MNYFNLQSAISYFMVVVYNYEIILKIHRSRSPIITYSTTNLMVKITIINILDNNNFKVSHIESSLGILLL